MRLDEEFERNPFVQQKEQYEISSEAELRLRLLGLSLSELEKYRDVLDLGAGLCHIERAARMLGCKNVVSVGDNFPKEIKGLGLNYKQMDILAGTGELKPGSFDLIVSRKGPFSLSRNKIEATTMLENSLALLSQDGQIRANPLRFGFIKAEMFEQNQDYANINAKLREHRSAKEIQAWQRYNLEANIRTQERLRNLGYVFSVHQTSVAGISEDDNGYLVFTKNDNPKR